MSLISELGFLFSLHPIFLVLLFLVGALSFPCIFLQLWLPSGHFFSHLCLLSEFLATSAVNVFLLEAHFMLAFTRACRTGFLGLPAHWLLSLPILAVLDISSLGDLLSLSPGQCCLPCHCPPPLLGHGTWEPLFAAETSPPAQMNSYLFIRQRAVLLFTQVPQLSGELCELCISVLGLQQYLPNVFRHL